ncbi:hypothetical protein ACFYYH_34145 [Streptomyces sp. NPDC002018]|uniref:hypothetical protein n=1 Tax=Streptomyces sp. NPDC002018 TaxID=3364629 RepID=UPI0036C56BE6
MTELKTEIKTRRQYEAEIVGNHLSLLGLPADSVGTLSRMGRLRTRARGTYFAFSLSGAAYLLVNGCISQTGQPGKVRLWRDSMLFESVSSNTLPGTYNEDRTNIYAEQTTSYAGVCLSRSTFIEFPNSKLSLVATEDSAIGLMLARMANKRYVIAERLYTATRANPVTRVAAVLDYLTETTRRNLIKTREDGALVMTVVEEPVASGPSQADIADALCLGRATVEKAISELRQAGALKAFSPGERTNRCYPVKDWTLLKQIALGG